MNEIVYKYSEGGVDKTINFTTEENLTILKLEYPYVRIVDSFKVSPLNRRKMAYDAINSKITWNHDNSLTGLTVDLIKEDIFYHFVVINGVDVDDYKKDAMLPYFNEETLETELVSVPNAVYKTVAELTIDVMDIQLPEFYLGFGQPTGSLFNTQ